MTGSEKRQIDRRSAIKKGVVGAASAGLVWSGPQIERLTLRPHYAAAQTMPPNPVVIVVMMNGANVVPPSPTMFTGTATLTFDRVAGTVQVEYMLSAGFMPTLANIHGEAVAGSNARALIRLGVLNTTIVSTPALVEAILANPELYYIQMSSAPATIRGQLA